MSAPEPTTIEQALATIDALRREHGLACVIITRADAEARAGRPLREDEWLMVQRSWGWRMDDDDLMQVIWGRVYDALADAGVEDVQEIA